MNAPFNMSELGQIDLVTVASRSVLPPSDPSELAMLMARKNALVTLQRSLLPIEKSSAPQIKEEIAASITKLMVLQRRAQVLEFNPEYQLFDPTPLKWRDAAGLPIFAVFRHDHPLAGFKATAIRERRRFLVSVEMLPRIPSIVRTYFKDIEEMMQQRCTMITPIFGESELTMLTNFGGLIPADVKLEIRRAEASGLFTHLLIVAEVLKWTFNQVVTSRQGDPLLIAIDRGGEFWLAKAFDTTSIEQLVRDEFATRA